MKPKEIVKLFREGLCIDMLTEKEWAEQKESRKVRQAAYHKQKAYVQKQLETDKDFKLSKKEKVVVGKPCTRFMALEVVEKAIYNDLMKERESDG